RRRGLSSLILPRPRARAIWCDAWKPPETWLQAVVARLREDNACVLFGGAYDRWDLEVRGGTLGAARLRMCAEDHGAGHQYIRFRFWPRWPAVSAAAALLFVALSVGAALGHAWIACATLAAAAALVVGRALWDSAVAASALRRTL